jgi:hypothetical protein
MSEPEFLDMPRDWGHHLTMVTQEGWRVVRSPKRKRKLRKRGENIQWSPFFNGWIWKPRIWDVRASTWRSGI